MEKILVENYNGLNIYFEPLEEWLNLEDMFSEKEDIEQIGKQLDNFELVLFCAKITAELEGIELASDYLGACIYEDYTDFYTKYKNDYYIDMRENVVKEAKKEIERLKEVLINY